MGNQIRLDKYLSHLGTGTRSQVKERIRKGAVLVNGQTVRTPEYKVDPEADRVTCNGVCHTYEKYRYFMLHKPAGVISATTDQREKTVLDLIKETAGKTAGLFPVGRLDKDAEGLLLLSNDGDLAHRLLSPKNHVAKVYYARIEGRPDRETIEKFQQGLVLKDGSHALPAQLVILKEDVVSQIQVTIYEGKFHQVKRMFQAVGMKVLYLKRLSMGSLFLDPSLEPGQSRPLTRQEIENLRNGD